VSSLPPHGNRTLTIPLRSSDPDRLPVNDYLPLLRPNGTFVLVGLVPEPLSIPSFSLILSQVKVAGSNIGSPATLRKMFDFAVEHDIGTKKSPSPYIQKYNMDDINQALPDFKAGKPRYRFVLVNTDNGAKL
jgi:D-arabinose 1-dehydrogenase-like Zn-dependent alcohol dehydrogenase